MSRGAWLFRPWALRASAWALGVVMVAAAWPKLVDPPAFAQTLYHYRLLSAGLLHPAALVLPWLELLVGLALVLGPGRRGAAMLALALMLLFGGALGLNLARHNPVDCGCFGSSGPPRSPEERLGSLRWALLRDGVLALLALHLLAAGREGERPRP